MVYKDGTKYIVSVKCKESYQFLHEHCFLSLTVTITEHREINLIYVLMLERPNMKDSGFYVSRSSQSSWVVNMTDPTFWETELSPLQCAFWVH